MTTQATQKLVTDVKVLVADAQDLAKVTANQAGEKIAALRGKIEQTAADLKPRLNEAETALRERSNAAAMSADSYVRAQPWAAVGIAAGVGLIIGLLIGRH
jgi:ElaB/YqjD/DUF883 family membrane-anchored ribosome-binding protein